MSPSEACPDSIWFPNTELELTIPAEIQTIVKDCSLAMDSEPVWSEYWLGDRALLP